MGYILYIRCFFGVYLTIYPLNLGIFSSSACGFGKKMPRFRGYIVSHVQVWGLLLFCAYVSEYGVFWCLPFPSYVS